MSLTGEHIHKIVTHINYNPAASRENTYVLDADIDWLKESFNDEALRMLDSIPFKKERDREITKDTLLIKDVHILYDKGGGKFFLIPFSDGIGIFGMTDADKNCKMLVCAYTVTEIFNIQVLTGMILDTFIKILAPEADPKELINELQESSEHSAICGGVRFSLFGDEDLIWLSAISDKAPFLIEEDD